MTAELFLQRQTSGTKLHPSYLQPSQKTKKETEARSRFYHRTLQAHGYQKACVSGCNAKPAVLAWRWEVSSFDEPSSITLFTAGGNTCKSASYLTVTTCCLSQTKVDSSSLLHLCKDTHLQMTFKGNAQIWTKNLKQEEIRRFLLILHRDDSGRSVEIPRERE